MHICKAVSEFVTVFYLVRSFNKVNRLKNLQKQLFSINYGQGTFSIQNVNVIKLNFVGLQSNHINVTIDMNID